MPTLKAEGRAPSIVLTSPKGEDQVLAMGNFCPLIGPASIMNIKDRIPKLHTQYVSLELPKKRGKKATETINITTHLTGPSVKSSKVTKTEKVGEEDEDFIPYNDYSKDKFMNVNTPLNQSMSRTFSIKQEQKKPEATATIQTFNIVENQNTAEEPSQQVIPPADGSIKIVYVEKGSNKIVGTGEQVNDKLAQHFAVNEHNPIDALLNHEIGKAIGQSSFAKSANWAA